MLALEYIKGSTVPDILEVIEAAPNGLTFCFIPY